VLEKQEADNGKAAFLLTHLLAWCLTPCHPIPLYTPLLPARAISLTPRTPLIIRTPASHTPYPAPATPARAWAVLNRCATS